MMTRCGCGDPAVAWYRGKPVCADCWLELAAGVIPGPEKITGAAPHVPEGVRICRVNHHAPRIRVLEVHR